MISLLLDQGLPTTAAPLLNGKGFDVLHVADIGLSNATDLEILEYARGQGRVVVTLDADFHALLKVGGHATPSVIRLRLEGLKAEDLAELLAQVVSTVIDDVKRGALVTVNARTIRVHRLK